MQTKINLDQFLINKEIALQTEPGLKEIYYKLEEATKKISHVVNHAALVGILGKADKENVQGEEVMKLDELSNDWLIES